MRRFSMIHLMAVLAILCSFQLARAGVLLSEGFEDVSNLPVQGWYMINHSEPLGLTDWFQGDDTLFPAQGGGTTDYAAANYSNTSDIGTISNWLLTPVLNFAAIDQLSFYTRTVDPPEFPDRLEVRVSTSGNSINIGTAATDVGAFNTVLVTINPVLDLAGYPSGWTQYVITSVDPNFPTSGTGRLAFRYFVTDGGPNGSNSDYIGIDTVEILSKEYTITPTAGANGTISPSAPVTVSYGSNQTFTMAPAPGYHVADVLVDGVSVGAVTNYTFTNVTANHTIEAIFSDTYTITASAGANGSITPSGTISVLQGASQGFTITPDLHYHVANVLVDGVSVGAVTNYTFTNVSAYHTIVVNFAIDTNPITASAGPNGTINPSGDVAVDYGSNQSFSITPANHYHVADVLVDSVSVGAVTLHTFTNVTAPHTIAATFAIDTYTITASAGANGAISPSGSVVVDYGNSQGFNITPAANYHVADVLVDSVSVGAVTNYTFTNVAANHTISVNFAIDTYTLTVALTGTGSGSVTSDLTGIDCGGDCEGVYDYGRTVILTATPDPGSTFRGWSGDCTGTDTTCTVTMDQAKNVTAEFHSFSWNLFLPAIIGNGRTQP